MLAGRLHEGAGQGPAARAARDRQGIPAVPEASTFPKLGLIQARYFTKEAEEKIKAAGSLLDLVLQNKALADREEISRCFQARDLRFA